MSPAEYRKTLTNRIIEQLETGTAPWIKPWDDRAVLPGQVHNMVTSRPYQGGNSLWLQCQGYVDPRWCTYKQAQRHGWQIRKGEKAAVVEYWKWGEQKKDEADNTVGTKLDVPKVFYAHVFNAAQIEGVPEIVPAALDWKPESAAEHILVASGAQIVHDQSDRAFYSPQRDEIHLPPKQAFLGADRYYSTALHELGHWSGHESRLGRDLSGRFGSEDYAREELRAELASFFLSSRLGIPHDPGNHAAYVESWIKALRKDHNEIYRAAKDAERITEFVLQYQKERVAIVRPESVSDRDREEELEC
jgi:antirestriction protein ArdC